MLSVSDACLRAKANADVIAHASEEDMNRMLAAAADALVKNAAYIIEENKKDCEACTRGDQFVDRLRRNCGRACKTAGIAMPRRGDPGRAYAL